jgi:hypothetical protein
MLENTLKNPALTNAEKRTVQQQAQTKGIAAALGLLGGLLQAARERYRAMEAKIEREEAKKERRYQQARTPAKPAFDMSHLNQTPPPPLTTRVLTIIPALLGFLVLDVTLVSLTIANTVAIGLAPDPFSKGVFVAQEIILSSVDVFVAYLHVSYAHWVVTGRGIHQWSDLTDWELRP